MSRAGPTIEATRGWSFRLAHSVGGTNFKVGHIHALLGWDAAESTVRLLVGHRPGRVEYWDADSGVRLRSIEVCPGSPAAGVQVDTRRAVIRWSRNNPQEEVGEWWDLDAGVSLGAGVRCGSAFAVSQDGRLGVAWELAGVTTQLLAGGGRKVTVAGRSPVAVAPDGSRFLTGPPRGDSGALIVWRSDGRLLGRLKSSRWSPVGVAVFSADARAVVFQNIGLECQEIATRRRLWSAHFHTAALDALARSPDGGTYYSLCHDHRLCATDARGQIRWTATLRRPREHRFGVPAMLAVSPSGARVAVVADGVLRTFDARTGAERSSIDGHAGAVSVVAVSPDGRLVASGGYDGDVRVYDAQAGTTLWTLEVDANGVVSIEFLPDRPALRTGGRDNSVRLWNLTTGFEEARWDYHSAASQPTRVRGSLDGSRVLTWAGGNLELSSDRAVGRVIWSVPLWSFEEAFTRDESLIVACRSWVSEDESNVGFETVDLRTLDGGQVGEGRLLRGQLVVLRETEDGPIVVTRDGEWLVVRGEWGDRRERQLPCPRGVQTKPPAEVSADGRWFVVAGRTVVEVWDLHSAEGPTARIDLLPTEQGVTSVAVSAAGATIAVGTDRGLVMIFALAPHGGW